MELYLRSAGLISTQKTQGEDFFSITPQQSKGDELRCIEPEYSQWIDPKWMRRMSRVIKMGTAAAMECLRQANIKSPDALITGSAFGCLEDTEIFLKKMVENKEELLSPTSFIQSTHNTVGAQIALLLQCHQYNNTHVHRAFSFENALLDAMILLQGFEASNVLVGGVDEITRISHDILRRFGIYKREGVPVNENGTYHHPSHAGEGAGFFMLSSVKTENTYCMLDGLSTFYKPSGLSDIEKNISGFLEMQSLTLSDIDLIITGENGNPENIMEPGSHSRNLFPRNPLMPYKFLSGEFPTSAIFAVWLAMEIIKKSSMPDWFPQSGLKTDKKINHILIYNPYYAIHHSVYLISAC
jgi:3-oxoacyl-[acyl-carrier-protein] synthase II